MTKKTLALGLLSMALTATVRADDAVNVPPPAYDPNAPQVAPVYGNGWSDVPAYDSSGAVPVAPPSYDAPVYAPPAYPVDMPVNAPPYSYAPPPPPPPLPSDAPVNAMPGSRPLTYARDKATTSGLGIGAGIGSDNVFFGGHLMYYAQLPNPRTRLAFHYGMGVMPAPRPGIEWGFTGGTTFSYGLHSRLIIDVFGGTIDWRKFYLHSEALRTLQTYGVGFGIGYELMTEWGFYLRTSIGPALAITPEVPFQARHVYAECRYNLLSVGYKLW